MGHGEIMDIDGTVNDVGNNKVLLLKGHESEVDLTVNLRSRKHVRCFYRVIQKKKQWKFGRARNTVGTQADR